MRIVTDMFAWAGRELPEWNPISISGYHIREAGSTAVQEVAFTFANAIAYIEAAIAAGLDVDDFAPRLSFFFNAHSNFLEEIAKFRAARRLYARLMRERFGARNPRTLHASVPYPDRRVDADRAAARRQHRPDRARALAAVLGGTQSLHTNSRDEALSLPTEESARLALRTQQIIAYETGVTNTADPVGGSEYIEASPTASKPGRKNTSRRSTPWAAPCGHRERLHARGNPERRIRVSAGGGIRGKDYCGGQPLSLARSPFPIPSSGRPAEREAQIARLKELRATRNQSAVEDRLHRLRETAQGSR